MPVQDIINSAFIHKEFSRFMMKFENYKSNNHQLCESSINFYKCVNQDVETWEMRFDFTLISHNKTLPIVFKQRTYNLFRLYINENEVTYKEFVFKRKSDEVDFYLFLRRVFRLFILKNYNNFIKK